MTSSDTMGQWCGFLALLTPAYLLTEDVSFLPARINYYLTRFFQFWMNFSMLFSDKKNQRKETWETSYRWSVNRNYILTCCHFSDLTNEEGKPAWQHHFSNGTEHKACKLEQGWKNLAFAALAAVRQCGMGGANHGWGDTSHSRGSSTHSTQHKSGENAWCDFPDYLMEKKRGSLLKCWER